MLIKQTLYAIAHAPNNQLSGKFLLDRGVRFTTMPPAWPSQKVRPRLYRTLRSAQASLRNYCMGRWKKEISGSAWNGDYEESVPTPIPGTERSASDFMIIPVDLIYKDTPA
tara:strand:- start:35958 stop:36290 length:333 start_codon:yes stop_codon:yes gene_type:complete